MPLSPAELDGRVGEGLCGGHGVNRAHANVVLAARGSATGATVLSMLAQPSPGHTPVMVCVDDGADGVEPVWPPTYLMNKATAVTSRHQLMTWGAGQLGVARGVLDAVADGLIAQTGDLYVLVALYIDERVDDETALCRSARAAVRKAIGTCVDGRDAAACASLVERRETLRNPFYEGE